MGILLCRTQVLALTEHLLIASTLRDGAPLLCRALGKTWLVGKDCAVMRISGLYVLDMRLLYELP